MGVMDNESRLYQKSLDIVVKFSDEREEFGKLKESKTYLPGNLGAQRLQAERFNKIAK